MYTLTDFHFEVPDALVAQTPAEPRDSARLMVLRREAGTIEHHVFSELPHLLDPGHAIVLNNSRVIKARLAGRRADGAELDLFLLRELGQGRWLVLGDSLAMPSPGEPVTFAGSALRGELLAHGGDGTVTFAFSGVPDMHAELERIGQLPLPPYIRTPAADERYQTVYARHDGSVAAPTAGLHFTPAVFDGLAARGVAREEVTLHVGYGTFARVTSDALSDHAMHAEAYTLDAGTAERLNRHRAAGGKLLSVGTTATRVIESCAGVDGMLAGASGETRIFIHPPYRFRAVDALLTNFHMPGFTPIMLVAAFAGYELTMRAYREAVAEGYRFYSFGDAMLVL